MCNNSQPAAYANKVKQLELSFDVVHYRYILRAENMIEDELSTLASI
jgi:hypothetical protein